MLVVYPLPGKGKSSDIRVGVGVDCLFQSRRLAMPREDKLNIVPRFFYVHFLSRFGDGGDV